MASAVTEEYLETIYNLTMEGEPVIGARLAEKFRVSRPTVTETLKRLVAEGYAVMDEHKHVSLTPRGQELTEQVLRRHRLAERLLFDVLKMDAIASHEQAHALEHTMTDEMAQAISDQLGHPLTCPHGNPIPGNATSGIAFLRERSAFRLSETEDGQQVQVVLISEVVEDESEVLRRLGEKRIYPGQKLTVERTGPDAMTFMVDGQSRSLSRDLATKIWVAAPGEGNHQQPS